MVKILAFLLLISSFPEFLGSCTHTKPVFQQNTDQQTHCLEMYRKGDISWAEYQKCLNQP
jgi:hypothetical protein